MVGAYLPSPMAAARMAGANARVRGLYARLLSEEQWDELLRAEGFRGALELLATTGYGEALGSLAGEAGATLRRVERQLWAASARNCWRAGALLAGQARTVFRVWWQHWELENLKTVFRGVHHGLDHQAVGDLLIPLEQHPSLPWDLLLHESSVLGLIERTQGTHYINPLRNVIPAYLRDDTLFAIEVALDVRYYRDVAQTVQRLSTADRAPAQLLLGTYIDMLNILWAYRYRIYYGLSPEEIVNYTLWHTWHTDADLVRDIALGAAPREIVERIWGTWRVDVSPLEGLPEGQMLPLLEKILERYWRGLAVKAVRGFPFGMGALLGYVILDELECRDVVRALEGKAIGWSPERIRQVLVRGEE